MLRALRRRRVDEAWRRGILEIPRGERGRVVDMRQV